MRHKRGRGEDESELKEIVVDLVLALRRLVDVLAFGTLTAILFFTFHLCLLVLKQARHNLLLTLYCLTRNCLVNKVSLSLFHLTHNILDLLCQLAVAAALVLHFLPILLHHTAYLLLLRTPNSSNYARQS